MSKRNLLKEFVKPEEIEKIEKKEKEEIEQIKFEYPYKLATTIPTKTSVSKIKKENTEQKLSEEITFIKPAFLQNKEEKITGAQKGTLVHLCLQKLDESKEYTITEIKQLISSLVNKQIITEKEAEAINPFVILEFTNSNIWKELQTAKIVQKERPFYINIPAKDIYTEATNEDEKVLVQGIIDLYYQNKDGKYVLVDYKTDYVEKGQEEILIKRYKKQLELYKKALEETLQTKVSKCYIYSTWLGTINV